MSEVASMRREGSSGEDEEDDIGRDNHQDGAGETVKLEKRLTMADLQMIQSAFEKYGVGDKLEMSKRDFCRTLSQLTQKGSIEEYAQLFEKIDIAGKEGRVDWDKFATHVLLDFYERDDRVKSTQLPQWKPLKLLQSPHKEVIQSLTFLRNLNRYLVVSKDGLVSMWEPKMKLSHTLKVTLDTCKSRDIWITDMVALQSLNKLAFGFTSKEIVIFDLTGKLLLEPVYRISSLPNAPLCMHFWIEKSEAMLCWGDTGGLLNAVHFHSANVCLFERPTAHSSTQKEESCMKIQLKEICRKQHRNVNFLQYKVHSEWVRQVCYCPSIECFMSCSSHSDDSFVIAWMAEKQLNPESEAVGRSDDKPRMRILKKQHTTTFTIPQGVNAFDYHEQLNMIATAGVNHQVCLWSPYTYVVSKPTGILRGHVASVQDVKFHRGRNQIYSFSKDKVLRIWDTQLQICLSRIAGIFLKGPEMQSLLFLDETRGRLLTSFNYQLTSLEMKAELGDKIQTHADPVVSVSYNKTTNEVISGSEAGTLGVWRLESGQRVKQLAGTHGQLTSLALDAAGRHVYTSGSDGTVKVWDVASCVCQHVLHCTRHDEPADVGKLLVLKRLVIAVGWSRALTSFPNASMRSLHVNASEWRGGVRHEDDVLTAAFAAPNVLVTASYDGQILVWNLTSEQLSRRLIEPEPAEPGNGSPSRAITCLRFLLSPRWQSQGVPTLVSSSSSGTVRFWDVSQACLLSRFDAFESSSSVVMDVDANDEWLATADGSGLIKIWSIRDLVAVPDSAPPPLQTVIRTHGDSVNELVFCNRNERLLLLSASSDTTVAVHDVYGNMIGIFGQEKHWKIEPLDPAFLEELARQEEHKRLKKKREEEEELERERKAEGKDEEYEPEEVSLEEELRINAWQDTILGKDYQEMRVKKRERRQPATIVDLAYIHSDTNGAPPAGPFAALGVADIAPVGTLKKPEFMNRTEKIKEITDNKNEYNLQNDLNAAFDEQSLFPRELLEFESRTSALLQSSLSQKLQLPAFQSSRRGGATSSLASSSTRSPRKTTPRSTRKF